MKEQGIKVDYLYGTMIEVPRAAVTADELGATAEFFSFGTNDLTQMTFGYSRDDVNSFLPDYLKKEILERDRSSRWTPAGSDSSFPWQSRRDAPSARTSSAESAVNTAVIPSPWSSGHQVGLTT
jgi:hypothetical protein